MQKKHGKFYADWRDEKGVRHRKALTTKRAALQLVAKHRKEQASKKEQASAPSALSRAPGKKPTRNAATPKQPRKN